MRTRRHGLSSEVQAQPLKAQCTAGSLSPSTWRRSSSLQALGSGGSKGLGRRCCAKLAIRCESRSSSVLGNVCSRSTPIVSSSSSASALWLLSSLIKSLSLSDPAALRGTLRAFSAAEEDPFSSGMPGAWPKPSSAERLDRLMAFAIGVAAAAGAGQQVLSTQLVPLPVP